MLLEIIIKPFIKSDDWVGFDSWGWGVESGGTGGWYENLKERWKEGF